jgi:DNA-binding response OmpR family regulator
METRQVALLVADNPDTAVDVRRGLGDRAVNVDIAADANAALALLDANLYRGIVIDSANSSPVLQHIGDHRIRIPVVMTGNVPADVAHDEVRLLLPKPCDASLLVCAILGLCGIES